MKKIIMLAKKSEENVFMAYDWPFKSTGWEVIHCANFDDVTKVWSRNTINMVVIHAHNNLFVKELMACKVLGSPMIYRYMRNVDDPINKSGVYKAKWDITPLALYARAHKILQNRARKSKSKTLLTT